MTEEKQSLSRRTIVKGAAWSVPVIAAAVATPLAAASPRFDVRVTAVCSGQYDIASLESLLASVNLLGLPVGLNLTVLTNLVKAALSALGFNEGATRRFEISADEGTIPAGTEFLLSTNPPAIINLTALQNLLAVQALFVASVNPQGFVLTTTQPISATAVIVELQSLLLNANVAASTTLALLDPTSDNPTDPGNEAPDSGTINTLAGADVDLGTLNLGAVLTSVLPGVVNAALRAAISLILRPGGTLAILDGLNLRVQLCAA